MTTVPPQVVPSLGVDRCPVSRPVLVAALPQAEPSPWLRVNSDPLLLRSCCPQRLTLEEVALELSPFPRQHGSRWGPLPLRVRRGQQYHPEALLLEL